MIKWIIRLIYGDDCLHEWDKIKQNETPYETRYLFVCKKCGRFKKVSI